MGKKKEQVNAPILELRANEETGEIQGYFAVWDLVDSHNTLFQRGCFAKSISERMDKIVIRNDHGNPIGKPLEIREDDHGAFFIGKISLEVDEARDAFILIRDKVVTGLSFAFRKIQDKFNDEGIRTFTEVALLEISPTWLPSGDDSRITGFRTALENEKNIEERSTVFEISLLEQTEWFLSNALDNTLWEIWWMWRDEGRDGETIAAIDQALADYHAKYLEFATMFINVARDDQNNRSMPFGELAQALSNELSERGKTLKEFAADLKLEVQDLESLCRNEHIADTAITALLPDNLRKANNQLRNSQFEKMFTDLRQFMTSAEFTRANVLVNVMAKRNEPLINQEEPTDIFGGKSSQILSQLETMNRKKS
jgi:HK97 family phage prohead protease